ncbi:hypothetical protein BN1723_018775, partial [Verticillium longisporum]
QGRQRPVPWLRPLAHWGSGAPCTG